MITNMIEITPVNAQRLLYSNYMIFGDIWRHVEQLKSGLNTRQGSQTCKNEPKLTHLQGLILTSLLLQIFH